MMRKTLIFFIIVLVIIIGVLSFPVFAPSNPDIGKMQEKKQVTVVFVPVSKFENIRTNYTYTELSEKKLFSLTENSTLIPDGLNIEFVANQNELSELLKKDEIAILLPDQVSPKFKSLSVDGNSIWAKEFDESNYPLKRSVSEEIAESFHPEEMSTIFAGGEIIPARAVDRLGLNKYDNYTYLFDYFKDDIANADISLAQLENPLNGNPTPCTGCMSFVGDEKVASALKEIGFDWLTGSGNHAGDGGQKGYSRTVELMNEVGIQFTGVANNQDYLLKPAISEVKGKKIGMLSADDIAYFYWKLDPNSKAYGTNWFSKRSENGVMTIDTERVNKIGEIKSANKIDYLIVFMSWGVEYTNVNTDHQKELAHALIDAGADIIVASHPHWVQNIEFYNDTPILYSMGNFIFDQTHTTPTRQGYVVNLRYYKGELKSIEIMPHQTCGYHQTKNDLAKKLIDGEMTLDQTYYTPEKEGCVYWQPKQLKEDNPAYQEILERVFEHTEI